MKIAMTVRGFIPVPRPSDMVYGIIDLAQSIAEQLASRGHQIDFYAPDGSCLRLPVTVRGTGLRPLASNRAELNKLLKSVDLLSNYMPAMWDHRLAIEMFQRANAGEYDLLHFHHPESSLSLASLFPRVPVAYTLHDPLSNWHHELFDMFSSPNHYCISISDRQRKNAPKLPYAATIYDGVDTDVYAFSPDHDDYLLFCGRVVPDKGVSEAVRIARRTGHKLVIIGPVLPENRQYFNKLIKPYLGDQIVYLGYKKNEDTIPYFQKAKCMLLPLKWDEPFGVTMIESMSCGTPVVVMRRGSAAEVVEDGKTGFVCNRLKDLAEAVKKVDRIRREDCRARVEKFFAIQNMVDDYERVFASIIAQHAAKLEPLKALGIQPAPVPISLEP